MAHEVETMFSVRETPWHGLGTILQAPPTSTEAMQCAGLAWDVVPESIVTARGETLETRVMRRSDTGAIVGEVGPKFVPLQNGEAFAWFDPFVRSGEATYETAGSLRMGRRVWILASLKRDPLVIVKRSDDTVKKYLLLSNSHDGSLAVRVGFTPTRVVCANTLAIAHNGRGSELLKIRHTKGVHDAIDDVREIINAADARFEATAEQYRALAARDISAAELACYVRAVFKVNVSARAEAKSTRERAAKRAAELAAGGVLALPASGGFAEAEEEKDPRALGAVTDLFESGRGNQLPGVRGTYWAAYNAVTEYLQYARRGSAESRLESLAWGAGAKTSRDALETAFAMARA